MTTNNRRSSAFNPRKAAAVAIAAILGPGLAFAQSVSTPDMSTRTEMVDQSQQSRSSLGVHVGYHKDYRKAMLAYETPAVWSHQFQSSRLDLNLELSASYWEAAHRHSDSMWQLSLKPVLRWWTSDRFFLEGGVGPSVLTSSHFAGREFGSRFQFNSHVGAGFVIQKAHRITLRYSHSSNGGVSRPNPGLDTIELGYAYQF